MILMHDFLKYYPIVWVLNKLFCLWLTVEKRGRNIKMIAAKEHIGHIKNLLYVNIGFI